MADQEYVLRLNQGIDAWNAWKKQYPDVTPDLSGADLSGMNLFRIDLSGADLREADLSDSFLIWANLRGADLRWANLSQAKLGGANLTEAILFRADLSGADLRESCLKESYLTWADLSEANLAGADVSSAFLNDACLVWTNLTGTDLSKCSFESAHFFETTLANTNLSGTVGLASCTHHGPSTLDHRTIMRSKELPVVFLRGCGLPDALIEEYVADDSQISRFHTCFIRYSQKDKRFARKVQSDLQSKGIRCWLAPADADAEMRIRDAVEDAVKVHDRILVVLSEHSTNTKWIDQEATAILTRERDVKKSILFPLQIDEAFGRVKTKWAIHLHEAGRVVDFKDWRNHEAYLEAMDRLLYGQKGTAQREQEAPNTSRATQAV